MPAKSPPTVLCGSIVRRKIVAMAQASLPNEACGLVAGRQAIDWDQSTRVEIVDVVAVRNALASPKAFTLDGQGMIDAENRIDTGDHVVIGAYHSHPTSQARPSPRDVADALRYDPDRRFVHLIASLQGFAPSLRAWRYGPTVDDCVELDIVGTET